MTLDEFKSIIAEKPMVVMKCSAEWCQPCKVLEKTLLGIEPDYPSIEFIHCDVEESDEIAAAYRIRSVPTMFYIVNGEIVDKTVGSVSETTLKEKLDAMSTKTENNG